MPLLAKWRHHELSFSLRWACIYFSLVNILWVVYALTAGLGLRFFANKNPRKFNLELFQELICGLAYAIPLVGYHKPIDFIGFYIQINMECFSLFISFIYVYLSSLILAVFMRKCLGRHLCKSSQFSIAMLNGTCRTFQTFLCKQ